MTLVAVPGIGVRHLRSTKRSRDKRGEVGHPPAVGGPSGDETPPR